MTLTTTTHSPQQLMVVWNRLLPDESEGPTLISNTALPSRSPSIYIRTRSNIQYTRDCELTRIVINSAGVPLDLGRAERLFTGPQRKAVIARDRECAWPDCHAHARWCHIHHLTWWQRDGGVTSVENGALLCNYHHHEVHRLDLTLTRHTITAGRGPGNTAIASIARVRYEFTDPSGRKLRQPAEPAAAGAATGASPSSRPPQPPRPPGTQDPQGELDLTQPHGLERIQLDVLDLAQDAPTEACVSDPGRHFTTPDARVA